jgi:hypothetical protein
LTGDIGLAVRVGHDGQSENEHREDGAHHHGIAGCGRFGSSAAQ